MDKTSSKDSTTKLSEAIRKLEDYSARQMQSRKDSAITKTMALVRSILSGKPDDPSSDKNEVLNAIELINSNRLFIEKLKVGTPADKELAEKFTRSINDYNDSCDKRIQGCIKGKDRLSEFFSKNKKNDPGLPKIALINKASVQRHYPESPLAKFQIQMNPTVAVPISRQSTELFHMKAIALLERYGIASNPEARIFVKKSPIQATYEKNSSICTLTQTLSLFPGQTILVKGSSALHPETRAVSQLLPESFSLFLESTQTGFPHPSQRAGWTLASQLIPEAPQRIDLLKHTATLLQRRKQAVHGLLQQGEMLKHAKELLSQKKKCFDIHTEEFVGLHQSLILTILKASSAERAAYDHTESFFHWLRTQQNPFEILNVVSHNIRESFIVKPHQFLLDSIIKGKSTDFGNPSPGIRYNAAKTILDDALDQAAKEMRCHTAEADSPEEKNKLDYTTYVGMILGTASKAVILQHISEDLIFNPPSLTAFECKMQAAAYDHLEGFLDELSTPLQQDGSIQEYVYELLKRQLVSDIALFEETSLPPIAKELSDYFNHRFISLSSL